MNAMINKPFDEERVYAGIPHGQERLATERERDDVNRRISVRASEKLPKPQRDQIPDRANGGRETGDQVNRFLLCALVGESSRHIKASALRVGEPVPMAVIVRGVLRCYRLAAMDEYGPLQGGPLDIAALNRLNEKVLKAEVARHSRDGVNNSEARLARAKRLGDNERIKVERDGLKHAIELRDRLAERLR